MLVSGPVFGGGGCGAIDFSGPVCGGGGCGAIDFSGPVLNGGGVLFSGPVFGGGGCGAIDFSGPVLNGGGVLFSGPVFGGGGCGAIDFSGPVFGGGGCGAMDFSGPVLPGRTDFSGPVFGGGGCGAIDFSGPDLPGRTDFSGPQPDFAGGGADFSGPGDGAVFAGGGVDFSGCGRTERSGLDRIGGICSPGWYLNDMAPSFEPRKLARLAELHYEGNSAKVIASTLRLAPRAVAQWIRALESEPLGLAAMHLAQRTTRLQWQARVRRSLAKLAQPATKVPRVATLTKAQFLARHYAPMRPVVLTRMMRDWKALTRWTLPWLKDRFGDAPIRVAENRGATAFYDLNVHAISRPTTLGAFVDWIQAVKVSNERYLVANNDGLGAPQLKPLIRDLGYFGGLMDRRRIAGFVYLWLGPAGTITPLHHDTTNILFCQVRGRKRFKLVSPLYGELLHDVVSYYSPMDLEAPDPAQYPFAPQLEVLEADLGPGDALLIPAGYWHHVRSLSVSLSVSMTNFCFPNAF